MSETEENVNYEPQGTPVKSPSLKIEASSPAPRRKMYQAQTPRRRPLERNSLSNAHLYSKTAPASPRRALYRNKSYSNQFSSTQNSDNFLFPSSTREMQDLKKRALLRLSLNDIEDVETFEELLFNLQYERKKLAERREFSECEEYNNAAAYVRSCMEKFKAGDTNGLIRAEKREAEKQLDDDLANFDKETEEMLKNFDIERDGERISIIRRHEEEVCDLTNKWETKKTQEYSHPTGELLNIHEKITHLIIQKNFKDAEILQHEFDNMKKADEEMRNKKRQEGFNYALSSLMKKQNDELDLFDKQAVMRRSSIETKRKIQRGYLMNRQMKINAPKKKSSVNFEQTTRSINGMSSSPIVPATYTTKEELTRNSKYKLSLPQLDTRQASINRMRKTNRQ